MLTRHWTLVAGEAPLGGDTEATQILVVTDTNRSRTFWTEVLGAELYREYGTSVVLRIAGSWFLLVTEAIRHLISLRLPLCHQATQIASVMP